MNVVEETNAEGSDDVVLGKMRAIKLNGSGVGSTEFSQPLAGAGVLSGLALGAALSAPLWSLRIRTVHLWLAARVLHPSSRFNRSPRLSTRSTSSRLLLSIHTEAQVVRGR